jgi:hypothetical protein
MNHRQWAAYGIYVALRGVQHVTAAAMQVEGRLVRSGLRHSWRWMFRGRW